MNTSQFIQQIRELVAQNDLPDAFLQLRSLLENSPKLDKAILQSARFQRIRQQIDLGLVNHAEANLTQNQICAGLLELLGEIEHKVGATSSRPDAPALRAEIERAISIIHSKNVVVGSTISAGGDVHFGDNILNQTADKIYNIEKIDTANFS